MRRMLAAAALAGIGAVALALLAGPAFVAAARPLVAWRFPEVAWISAEELEQRPELLLLDARSEAEFAVSRIRGARRLDARLQASLPKQAPIVVYCSLGYRSAEAADRLRAAGFSQVRNLEGGIFGWSNAGRPLLNDSGAVQVVHPYAAPWGLLLAPPHRARLR
jgi:rhodanese-related sulfurtransferase